ncbi:MAG: phospholipase [Pirellulales bacterium]
MGSFINLIAELNWALTQVAELQGRLARGPKQVKLAEANVQKCEADVAAAKDAMKKARIASDQQQLTLKQRDAKIYELEGKLNMAANNKEYQLLKDQIAADKQATAVLSDEILEGFERLESLAVEVKSLEDVLAKTKEELKRTQSRVAEAQAGIEAELAFTRERLVEREMNIPEDFRPEYDRLVKGRGQDALAAVENECCGGCFQTLSPQIIDLIRRDRLVVCRTCGRVLYDGSGR